jgi:hypothetical protein
MCPHEVSERARTKQRFLLALPTQQANYGSKGQILGEQTRPFLQTPRDNHAFMGGQKSIPRQDMIALFESQDLP